MKNFKLILRSLCALAFLFVYSAGYGQMKVINNGDVKIGETSNDPAFDLHIEATGTQAGFIVERSDAGNFMKYSSGTTGNALYFKNNKRFKFAPAANLSANTPGPEDFFFYGDAWSTTANAGNLGLGTDAPDKKLTVSGDIRATGMVTSSDSQLKTILKNSTRYGLNEVMKLNTVDFVYNGKGGTKKGSRHLGLVAQQLQKVAPNLVEPYTHVTYEYIHVPEENDFIQKAVKEDVYLAIKNSEVQYMLLNAIQDQQEFIDEQESRINELESRISEIIALIVNKKEIDLSRNEQLANVGQNIPNPFNESTKIDYFISEGVSNSQIIIYDKSGRVIRKELLKGNGSGELQINNNNLPSGVYSYSLVVDGRIISTKQMIIQN